MSLHFAIVINHINTAIIGGGIAGLSAARTLKDMGVEDVIVFEASGEVGGRIRTDEHGINHGAELIHSTGLAKKIHSLGLDIQHHQEHSDVYVYSSQRHGLMRDGIDGPTIAETIRDLRDEVAKHYLPPSEKLIGDHEFYRRLPPMSVLQYLECEASVPLRKRLSHVRGLVECALRSETGAEPDALSVRTLFESSALDDENFGIVGGFARYPRRLAEGLDIRLHSPADRIRWDDTKVQIDFGSQTIQAQRSIAALPLGVLQTNPLFQPELPTEHRSAIFSIGNGIVCKLIFTLNTRLWPKDMTLLRTDRPDLPMAWPNAGSVPSLTCYLGGHAARLAQKLPAAQVLDCAKRTLGEIFGCDFSAHVLRQQRTRWNEEPWSMTGYSYPSVRNKDARSLLAVPINRRLVLAGEACWPGGEAGTVYGAVLSGEAAAHLLTKT